MTDEQPIMGHWHKLDHSARCDACNRTINYLFVVREGPCTGKFCSRQHWEAAYQNMQELKKKGGNNAENL